MFIESFIEILNKTDVSRFDGVFFNNTSDEATKYSMCVASQCSGILCQNCPFNDPETFEKFKQELNEKIIPILKLQNFIEE